MRDGKRFLIRGVVYQPRRTVSRSLSDYDYSDPLRDECIDDLKADIELFKELGVNAIKVYTFLPHLSHDAAFEALAAANIYVLVGLSTPRICINRLSPHDSYTPDLLKHYLQVVDDVSKYDNVFGVVAADHVVNNAETTPAAEVVRAVIRDVKRHMRQQHGSHGQRVLPVGIADEIYAAKTTDSIAYFTAGDKEEQIDFYSFVKYDRPMDDYWDEDVQRFVGKNLPIFVSEYGSNIIRPRHFHETTSLFSSNVATVLSGGFVYDFVEGSNRYGLVTTGGQKLGDFDNLKARYQETEVFQPQVNSNVAKLDIAQTSFPPVSEAWRASSQIPDSLLTDV